MTNDNPPAPSQKFCPFMPPIIAPAAINPGALDVRMIPCVGKSCAAFSLCQEAPAALVHIARHGLGGLDGALTDN